VIILLPASFSLAFYHFGGVAGGLAGEIKKNGLKFCLTLHG
jgi:hypothetical protein